MGLYPLSIGEKSGMVLRGRKKDRSPPEGRGIVESRPVPLRRGKGLWNGRGQGPNTPSPGGITEPGSFKTGRNNPCEREHAWDCLGHHGHHREEEAALGWGEK